MTDTDARHVYVTGHVQGVYFRATTRDQARDRDVAGWVRNLPDGRVEAHFEGDPEAVAAMVAFCHEGPPAADVESVEAEPTDPEGFEDFSIRR